MAFCLFDLINCDAVNPDPEATSVREGWIHQERLSLELELENFKITDVGLKIVVVSHERVMYMDKT